MNTAGANAAFRREVSCKLKYMKVPDGKYEVEVTEELRFQPPFDIAAAVYQSGEQGQFVLQLDCKNILERSLSLRSYRLVLDESSQIVTDTNVALAASFVRDDSLLVAL